MSVDSYPSVATAFDLAEWSDAAARASLQFVVDLVAQMVGSDIAAISIVHGDVLVPVAIRGDAVVRSTLPTLRIPVADVRDDLAVAEDWGRFRFVSHDQTLAAGRL